MARSLLFLTILFLSLPSFAAREPFHIDEKVKISSSINEASYISLDYDGNYTGEKLNPAIDLGSDLGTPEKRWKKIYVETISASEVISANLETYEAHALSSQVTTNTVFADLDSMSITPKKGKYLVHGNCEALNSTLSGEVFLVVSVDGVSITTSQRHLEGNRHKPLTVIATAVVNGSETISLQWRHEGQGNSTIEERSIIIQGVSQ